MSLHTYLVPSQRQQFELAIKRSRFIATIAPAYSREEAKGFIQVIKEQYPDARHHCWAFIAGAPNDLYGVDQSDDGEPKDTAGKPMLNVLQHSGLGHVVLVVTRYFGGIKLGAGGLVRAYSQSASEAVKGLETRQYQVREHYSLSLPYSLLGTVEYWLEHHDIAVLDKTFNNAVCLILAVPLNQLESLDAYVNNSAGGVMVLRASDK